MGRPAKQTVEYFSHRCRHGRVIFIMESLWGNDGYSFFYKIYELLGDSEGHAFNLNKVGNPEYLSTYTRLSSDSTNTMLGKLADLGIIDGELLKLGLIWSQCFVDDLEDVYARRKVAKPTKPTHQDFCQQKPDSTGMPGDETTQKPSNDIKPNENKGDKKQDIGGKPPRFIPPTLEEVTLYCQERGKGIDPQRWCDYYAARGWMVGKVKMKDWKAAVRTWENHDKQGGSSYGNAKAKDQEMSQGAGESNYPVDVEG